MVPSTKAAAASGLRQKKSLANPMARLFKPKTLKHEKPNAYETAPPQIRSTMFATHF